MGEGRNPKSLLDYDTIEGAIKRREIVDYKRGERTYRRNCTDS